MKTLAVCISGLLLAGSALAADVGLSLAQKNGCLNCHAVDRKVIGPAYKDVAAKYRGQPGIEDKLVAKIRNGGGGVWGTMPMPPNPQVSDADLHTLVKWVLSTK